MVSVLLSASVKRVSVSPSCVFVVAFIHLSLQFMFHTERSGRWVWVNSEEVNIYIYFWKVFLYIYFFQLNIFLIGGKILRVDPFYQIQRISIHHHPWNRLPLVLLPYSSSPPKMPGHFQNQICPDIMDSSDLLSSSSIPASQAPEAPEAPKEDHDD